MIYYFFPFVFLFIHFLLLFKLWTIVCENIQPCHYCALKITSRPATWIKSPDVLNGFLFCTEHAHYNKWKKKFPNKNRISFVWEKFSILLLRKFPVTTVENDCWFDPTYHYIEQTFHKLKYSNVILLVGSLCATDLIKKNVPFCFNLNFLFFFKVWRVFRKKIY